MDPLRRAKLPICQPAAAVVVDSSSSLTDAPQTSTENNPTRKTPKRICRFPGCPNVVKSQGHCQKHGAIVKKCVVEGCKKQSQGVRTGHMCIQHHKDSLEGNDTSSSSGGGGNGGGDNNDNCGEGIVDRRTLISIYDTVMPNSIGWRQGMTPKNNNTKTTTSTTFPESTTTLSTATAPTVQQASTTTTTATQQDNDEMPLVGYLRNGLVLEPGWHRKHERIIRDPKNPLKSLTEFYTMDEKQLLLYEVMLLSGIPNGNKIINKDLAHAWGKKKGFHFVVVNHLCERRGDLVRRKRSDTGTVRTEEQKNNVKAKKLKANDEKSDDGNNESLGAEIDGQNDMQMLEDRILNEL